MELKFAAFVFQYELVDFINENNICKENIQNIIHSDRQLIWSLFYWGEKEESN